MMRLVSVARERLRTILFRTRENQETDEELRFHLEMETEKNLRQGMSPVEARRQARLTLGGVEQIKEGVRDARGLGWLEDVIKDAQYALRRLLREPTFSAALILTLALGIGGTTAMFSIVDATLVRPLPFANEERLVLLDHVEVGRMGVGDGPKLSADFTDLDSLRHVFAQTGAYAAGGLNLTGAGDPIRSAVALVTPGFFSTLGVQPAIGRPFTIAEGAENAPVVIVSNGMWRRHFADDPDVLGRTIHLNDVRYEVVGVMPRGFAFPEETEIWLPLPIPMTFSGLEVFRMVVKPQVVARLAPGVTVEQAGARLLALMKAYRPADRPLGATAAELVQPLRDSMVKSRRTALFILLGAAGLILLLACTNAANLLLSRAATRRREIALRAALGATSGRILRQLLAESVVIAGAAGLLGVIIAFASTGVLAALVPSGLQGVARPAVDGRVLLFASAVTLASGIGVALWPALHAGRADAGSALKSGARDGATARDATPLRRLFIVGELSLALILLVGAGMMLRSFQAVLAVDPGMRPERVATLELALARARHGSAAARGQFYADVLERLLAAPDVEAAAVVNELPMRGDVTVSLTVSAEGTPRAGGEDVDAQYLRVTPEYFRVLGIPLLLGRPARDDLDPFGQEKEVVVNLELARRLWPGESPIGKRLLEPRGARTVVGVVGNVRAHSLDRDLVLTQMYLPFAEAPTSNAALLVRGRGRPEALSARLREAVRTVDPTQAVYNVRSMEQVIARTIAPRRTATLLISAFGVLGLVLAAVGVYGVISLGVVQRRAEIGIRMALGARPSDVLRMIISEGLLLAISGIAIGLGCAWFLSRMLETLVYGIAPRDPLTFMVAPLILLGIAIVAAWIPARSAARADPLQSLRTE